MQRRDNESESRSISLNRELVTIKSSVEFSFITFLDSFPFSFSLAEKWNSLEHESFGDRTGNGETKMAEREMWELLSKSDGTRNRLSWNR